MGKTLRVLLCFFPLFTWWGCVQTKRMPPTPIPTSAPRPDPRSHLLGVWELPGKDGKIQQLVFTPDGRAIFRGGFEYFNPAQWALDPNRRELSLFLPQTPDPKLDIFKMYIGDGVKAFDRKQKKVLYVFDEQTGSLNIAGWQYFKADPSAVHREEEPVIK